MKSNSVDLLGVVPAAEVMAEHEELGGVTRRLDQRYRGGSSGPRGEDLNPMWSDAGGDRGWSAEKVGVGQGISSAAAGIKLGVYPSLAGPSDELRLRARPRAT